MRCLLPARPSLVIGTLRVGKADSLLTACTSISDAVHTSTLTWRETTTPPVGCVRVSLATSAWVSSGFDFWKVRATHLIRADWAGRYCILPTFWRNHEPCSSLFVVGSLIPENPKQSNLKYGGTDQLIDSLIWTFT